MSTTHWQVVSSVVCVMVAFFASVWVNAAGRLSVGRAHRLKEEAPKKGALLLRIAEDPSLYITSVLLLMLVARVAAVVLVTSAILHTDAPLPEVIAISVMSFVLFQVAEIAPRTWVIERLDQVLLFSARPLFWMGSALRPLAVAMINLSRVFLLILPGRGLPKGPLTSEEELKSILDVAQSEEVIEADERQMIHSIFEFGDTVVREVMVPRPDMVCVGAEASPDEALELALKRGFSRIPVISENIDNVVGIVNVRDLIKKTRNGGRAKVRKVSDVSREAVFVPESKKVAELLREMQKAKTHMVMVIDEYGGTAGLATMEDLLEEIVGEITDEYDREEPSVIEIDEQTFRVAARLDIDELNDLFGCELPHEDWDSVGGLVAGMLGRVASEGDVVDLQGIHFQVEKVKGRRIEKLLVSRESGANR